MIHSCASGTAMHDNKDGLEHHMYGDYLRPTKNRLPTQFGVATRYSNK